MSCPYAKGRATACIHAYCCVRTKKTRQPVKNRQAHLAAQSSFDATSPARALDENAFAAFCNERKSSRRQRSKLRLSAMRCADKRGRHSRHENKKRAKNRDTYAVFAHKKNRPPKAVCFFALVTCSAPDGRLSPSLPQAACGVLPTFWA